MNPLNASQSTVCGLAWKRYSRQTPLRDVAPALNGRASLAGVRPCRTGAASFMVARARGRARRRAAGEQIGNTGTFRGKPRRNGRACGRQYLRSAICATRSRASAVPRSDTDHTGPSLSPASMPMTRSPGLPPAGDTGLWADRSEVLDAQRVSPWALKVKTVAYIRTSSAANVGAEKDSDKRQRQAIAAFAKRAGLELVDEFTDAAVSGADHIETRPGFTAML